MHNSSASATIRSWRRPVEESETGHGSPHEGSLSLQEPLLCSAPESGRVNSEGVQGSLECVLLDWYIWDTRVILVLDRFDTRMILCWQLVFPPARFGAVVSEAPQAFLCVRFVSPGEGRGSFLHTEEILRILVLFVLRTYHLRGLGLMFVANYAYLMRYPHWLNFTEFFSWPSWMLDRLARSSKRENVNGLTQGVQILDDEQTATFFALSPPKASYFIHPSFCIAFSFEWLHSITMP